MALTIDQCDTLLGILDVQSVKNYSFESLSNEVRRKFENSEYFKVGTCIIMLLQTNLLPEVEQRLAAITILHELYRGELLTNTPFANVFIHLLLWPFYALVAMNEVRDEIIFHDVKGKASQEESRSMADEACRI
ncbi:CCR4-NOT transcription complex subunit 11-like, partial [Anoplophora glabripennis]|uniref:CCR4-NOT transcription complex subunit 11-like n=1 Tax=Anoplophora glabripennis TaxID=217634 RepID=UPI000873F847